MPSAVCLQVAQVLREDLLMVQLSDDTQHFKNEVQMFMTALAMDPPVVNLSGYATVNRALFASVCRQMAWSLADTLPAWNVGRKGSATSFDAGLCCSCWRRW